MADVSAGAACCRRRHGRQDFRRRVRAPAAPSAPVVAVIVPYRPQALQDRAKQLRAFEKHMASFLHDDVRFVLVVSQQSEDGRAFNRGQLLNVGFREAARLAAPAPLASVIFHDVDLLPSPGLLRWYAAPPKPGRPCHIAGPSTWGKYDMDGYADVFFGGVTAFHPPDFEGTNGFPNDYWGWGQEDDQLRLRADASGALARGVERPPAGAGRFDDLDSVRMLDLLRSPQDIVRNAPYFNQRMFQRRVGPQVLDEGWRKAKGLGGMQYRALSREETELPGGLTRLLVVAQLGE